MTPKTRLWSTTRNKAALDERCHKLSRSWQPLETQSAEFLDGHKFKVVEGEGALFDSLEETADAHLV